jgi:hypothetical protein
MSDNNIEIITNNSTKDKFSITEIKKDTVFQVIQQVNNSKTHIAEYREKDNKIVIRERLID